MAGKVVETVSLKLDLQGFAELQGLGNKFKKLENPIKLAGAGVTRLKNEIMGLGKVVPNTVGHLNAQADALTRVRQNVEIGTQEFKELTIEINRVNGAITKANASMNKSKFGGGGVKRGLGIIGGAMAFGGPLPGVSGLAGGLMSSMRGGDFGEGAAAGVGLGFAAKPVIEAVSGATTYAADINKSKIALEGATKIEGDPAASMEAYKDALATAARVTKEFNVPQEIAIKGMTRLSAAVIGAGGNVHNASVAFTSVIAAIKGTAGSSEDAKAAITALVQIYSKGKVSAEELSGQLGERFPAAVTKFAKANNMEAASLQKMLKDGTVGLDMLEKFVISLGKEYIPIAKKIAKSSEEAGARARVAFNELRISVGKQLIPIGEQFQEIGIQILKSILPAVVTIAQAMIPVFKAIAGIIQFVVNNFHALASIMAVVGAGFAAAAIQATGFTAALAVAKIIGAVKAIKAMIIGLKAMTLAQFKANLAALANPYVALAAGLAAATIWTYRLATAHDRMIGALEAGQGGEKGVKKAQLQAVEYRNSIEKLRLEIKELEGQKTLNSIEIKNLEEKKAEIVEYTKKINDITEAVEAFRKAVAEGESIEEAMKKMNSFLKKATEGVDGEKYEGFLGGLKKWKDGVKPIMEEIADVTASAFEKMASHLANFITTGKLNFKEFARSVIADLSKVIAKQILVNALTGGKTESGGIIGWVTGLFKKNANGNAFAQNGIVPYRKGGVVNAPTMFKYGGSKLGIMGEAGPEAIMPLKRGSNGKLGVAMHGSRGGGGTTNVNYTGPTLNFNGDEYVPRSAVGEIVNTAVARGAKAGEARTLSTLKNSRSSRNSIGL